MKQIADKIKNRLREEIDNAYERGKEVYEGINFEVQITERKFIDVTANVYLKVYEGTSGDYFTAPEADEYDITIDDAQCRVFEYENDQKNTSNVSKAISQSLTNLTI